MGGTISGKKECFLFAKWVKWPILSFCLPHHLIILIVFPLLVCICSWNHADREQQGITTYFPWWKEQGRKGSLVTSFFIFLHSSLCFSPPILVSFCLAHFPLHLPIPPFLDLFFCYLHHFVIYINTSLLSFSISFLLLKDGESTYHSFNKLEASIQRLHRTYRSREQRLPPGLY